MHHRPVELGGLIGTKQLPHGENVGERFLLQFAHRPVRLVNRCRDLWTITMLVLDSVGQTGVGGAQLKLKGPTAHGETLFDNLQLRLLPLI